jgi:uncharacterized protein (TIGR02996 family)
MHPEELAFLSEIVANPEDDQRRLVFADWLEERGETDRAIFIRLKILGSAAVLGGDLNNRVERLSSLIPAALESFTRAAPEGLSGYFAYKDWYSRGLLRRVAVPMRDGPDAVHLCENLERLLAVAPVAEVEAAGHASTLAKLVARPGCNRLTHLTLLSDNDPGELVDAVVGSRYLNGLQSLRIQALDRRFTDFHEIEETELLLGPARERLRVRFGDILHLPPPVG